MQYFINAGKKSLIYLKSFKRLGSMKLLFVLCILFGSVVFVYVDHLQPEADELRRQKTSHMMKKRKEKSKIKPSRIIECFATFAKIEVPDIWIHNLEYKNGYIDLIMHSINMRAVDEYINEVIELSRMFIISQETKNKTAKALLKNKAAPKKVPYALALLRKRQNKSKAKKTKDEKNITKRSEDVKEQVADYTYEATIKLKI